MKQKLTREQQDEMTFEKQTEIVKRLGGVVNYGDKFVCLFSIGWLLTLLDGDIEEIVCYKEGYWSLNMSNNIDFDFIELIDNLWKAVKQKYEV